MDIDKPLDKKPSRWDPALHAYVRQLADLLHLKDWRIVLDEEDVTDKVCMGQVWPVYGRRIAYISLNQTSWESYSKEQKRNTLVHELLHCHAEHLCDLVKEVSQAELGGAALRVFQHAFKLALEYMIDSITDAVAPTMPEYPD